jgi:HTH-type transcriptional regulator / antitoxin HigA
MAQIPTEFRPNFERPHPGELLRKILDARGVKIVEFAKRCGRPTKTISEIVAGKTMITPETALQFERVLGEGAGLWMNLEGKYQLELARRKETKAEANRRALTWAGSFPVGEMKKIGLLDKVPSRTELVDRILRAFGVSSIDAWDEYWNRGMNLARFKQQTHLKIDSYGVAAWLRRGEQIAAGIEAAPYEEAKFKKALSKVRNLTQLPWEEVEDDFIKICASVGVAVALVPMVSRTGLRGAAFWARKDKAVIILSDRNKRESGIWFAFFHEAAHILLHSKKAVFIDHNGEGTCGEDIESEADEFSATTIISNDMLQAFFDEFGDDGDDFTTDDLKDYADRIGIDADLLLVRLQHEGIVPQGSSLNRDLRRRVEF